MAEPVRIVFLGGLGEIGRNCMAIEQGEGGDRKILLIDCGLMFPDADMHGIDLVLPDFTYLRENADADRRRWSPPTATRTTSAASSSCCATATGSVTCATGRCRSTARALTLGLARHRIEEAGLLGRTELVAGQRRPDRRRSARSGSSSSRSPTRCRTPTRSSCTPRRASSSTPATASSTSPRSTAAAPTSPGSASSPPARACGCCWATRPTPKSTGYAPSETSVGGVLRALFAEHRGRRIITASFASHLHRIQQIADAAIADRAARSRRSA